jgi:small subunit ribosomal protein S5
MAIGVICSMDKSQCGENLVCQHHMMSNSRNNSRRPEPKAHVVCIKRSARTTKAGPRFSFSALIVVGDSCGRVGVGLGKSGEVSTAIQKAEVFAVAQMVKISLETGAIPHEVTGEYCGAKVLLRPASTGTGLIASRPVRLVLECAVVKDAITKSFGTHNPTNVVKATLRALMSLRRAEEIYKARDLKIQKTADSVPLKFPDLFSGKSQLHLN